MAAVAPPSSPMVRLSIRSTFGLALPRNRPRSSSFGSRNSEDARKQQKKRSSTAPPPFSLPLPRCRSAFFPDDSSTAPPPSHVQQGRSARAAEETDLDNFSSFRPSSSPSPLRLLPCRAACRREGWLVAPSCLARPSCQSALLPSTSHQQDFGCMANQTQNWLLTGQWSVNRASVFGRLSEATGRWFG
ncbi:unnamed protein product [Linum trigynum]|uniref:Uncharacterized protein n=1 Tax=Linum trigynum TaxID=586398 RepID=A0AAV2FQB3_9ROSI